MTPTPWPAMQSYLLPVNQPWLELVLVLAVGTAVIVSLAARDPAWQVLANLLSAALWWHPLVWWSRHRLRAASEAAADEASLLVPGGPDLLAACLVAMGRRLVPPPQLGWLSFEGPGFRSSLGRRVERLLNLRGRPWRAPGRGRLALAKTALPVALVIVTVCCTAWARPQATLTERGTTMNVLRASWRHSLAAAMLALVTAGCSDAVADNPPIDESTPAVVGDDSSDADGQLALLAGDQEGERRERREGEAREGERRERREGEAREGERRERREGEAREGERRPERPRPEPRGDLERQLRELRGEVRELRREIQALRQMLQRLLGRDRPEGQRRTFGSASREVDRRDRPEGERRDVDRRDRPEGERRDVDRPDRPEGERRDVDRRDRPEGERRDVDRPDRPEGEAREGEEREGEEGEPREEG